ncbi:Hypothetical_protein [Hexamita inflata]|uniref:Hypothetical_protein n=1 Tax=Hexamita inflata TaxID=28002 RepID=A0AA86RBQ1_9EUKA|nr:Hypothetical protein HINF_LOCUS62721 [Hexamita inflata]
MSRKICISAPNDCKSQKSSELQINNQKCPSTIKMYITSKLSEQNCPSKNRKSDDQIKSTITQRITIIKSYKLEGVLFVTQRLFIFVTLQVFVNILGLLFQESDQMNGMIVITQELFAISLDLSVSYYSQSKQGASAVVKRLCDVQVDGLDILRK